MNKKAKENTITRKLLLSITILSVFFIILFSSLFSFIYNLNYYEKKYQQYNVYDRFTKEEAKNATTNLFGFFKSQNELNNFYNEREKSHLNDVKILIGKANIIYIFSLMIFWGILISYYILNRKEIVKFFSNLLFYLGIFSISIFIIFALIYFVTGFDFLFIKFHELFFIGNYSFNPAVSNMKALFPDEFFQDIGIAIVLRTVLKSVLLIIVGYYIKKRK